MLNLAAVVILFNPESIGFETIVKNISSYKNYVKKVYLVDNSMSDNSAILANIEDAEYISNRNRGGIGGAQNIGFQKALENGCDWAMTMDQDTYFEPEQVKEYFRLIENSVGENKTVVSYSLRAENMTNTFYWIDPLKNVLRPFVRKIFAKKKNTKIFSFPVRCIASSNVVKLRAWKDVGGFDESLFIDQVDYDFCYRLIERGYKILTFNSVYMNQCFGEAHGFTLFRKHYAKYSRIRYYHCIRNAFVMKKYYGQYDAFYNKYIKDLFFDNCVNSIHVLRNLKIFFNALRDSRKFKLTVNKKIVSSDNQQNFKKYQLFEKISEVQNAGGKAPIDMCFFAEKEGFETLPLFFWGERNLFHRITGHIKRLSEYFILFFRLKRNSVLLMQFPYVRGGRIWRNLWLGIVKSLKHIKIITLIHDLNELRYVHPDMEKKLLDYSIRYTDVFITHNEKMSAYLKDKRGVSDSKIVPMSLFDYNSPIPEENIPFEKSISIAGNLDANKSAYLKALPKLGLTIYLYGMNYNNNNNNNIVYEGCFEPECITNELCHGFGLVWDGISADTCDGLYGKYLKYNNPHKLSMYLTAGLPVIVWKESALCEPVVRNKLGIAVSSLYEAVERINATTESEYLEMHKNCLKISEKLRSGYFLRTALRKCLERLADSEAYSGYTKSDVAPSADSVLSADSVH